jgi:general secretion pathway protein E
VLDELERDELISGTSASALLKEGAAKARVDQHPLDIIAQARLTTPGTPSRIIGLEELTLWLARRSGLDYLRIDPLKIDVASVGGLITPAQLGKILQKEIVRVVANPRDIERYRDEFFGVSQSVKGATAGHQGARHPNLQNLEALIELGKGERLDADDSHIVHIVDWLLQFAVDQRASDIHIEPRRDAANVRFRIDGTMHQVYQTPPAVMAAITGRIKILGRMDVAEKRRPQDGRIKTRTEDGRELEMRLSTMPTAFGEKLVMRIFNPDVVLKDFDALGFGPENAARWQSMVSQPNGIILVTGPTGSGKTTTLYSTLKHLARPEINVCTVEEPIEMVEPAFNQMQVQHNIGLDFASGIRTLMRQDPDIIMVGEIRDRETADMALQAALTGHLVLSTLHTIDAPSAITRLLDIGVPHYLIKAALLGVVAQRLVRTLCPHCKAEADTDKELWRVLTAPWKLTVPASTKEPVGCLECRHTGFHGRAGLYEILTLTSNLRDLIGADFDERALRADAFRAGMRPLRIGGALKVAQGVTSMDEVLKVAPVRAD